MLISVTEANAPKEQLMGRKQKEKLIGQLETFTGEQKLE